jgi:hypothetical protein
LLSKQEYANIKDGKPYIKFSAADKVPAGTYEISFGSVRNPRSF